MMSGKFVTLEGGEGVGKTTNLLFIRDYLQQRGINLLQTREPGGTAFAEKIRGLLLDRGDESIEPIAELLLVFAARAQHLRHVIQPALESGNWVLCDRFTDSTYAYQGGGRQMNHQTIAWLEQTVQGDLRPDLTLVLDLPVEIGMQRARQRSEPDRFESERREFFERVRHSYLQRAEAFPARYRVIDAAQGLTAVQSEIAAVLDGLIEHG